MGSPSTPEDLLDLKLLPAWVNEPPPVHKYADFQGDDGRPFEHRDRGPGRRREQPGRGPKSRDARPSQSRERSGDRSGARSGNRPGERRDQPGRRPGRHDQRSRPDRERKEREEQRDQVVAPPVPVTIRFLPHPPPFEGVVAQIKSGSVAYSVFALARLFLEKPERYDVKLTVPPEKSLFQLGEHGAVAFDKGILETGAFASSRDDFYTVEVTQSEPLKGNFTNVARCRVSGTLLGPTNHHNYQPQLRNLYESRFSRRMSFSDYQRQIEISSDPAVVEEWKEQARTVTTYTTKKEEPPVSFTSSAEVERHFRKNYLPGLLRSASELTFGGVLSRSVRDRALGRAIEQAWVAETRSPAKMMQELVAGLRQAGLNIFRHRRGMLFVTPIRARVFSHESAGVSASINGILEKVTASPGINLKQLAEQLTPAGEDAASNERARLNLASDLHWLVWEGYLIEFNDGSLDLPKTKPATTAATDEKAAEAVEADQAAESSVTEESKPEVVVAQVVEAPAPQEPAAPVPATDPAEV